MAHTIFVDIKGISPLLMHAYPMVEIPGIEKQPPEVQAEHAAYRIPGNSRELYLPGIALQRALVSAAGYSKGKGRSSLVKQTAACVLVSPEWIGLTVKEYAIDARPVVIPATKGRIIRYRPRLDSWECSFSIEFDETLLSEKQLREIVDNCGSRVGVLDFRPEKKGPFGRFMVVKWERLEARMGPARPV